MLTLKRAEVFEAVRREIEPHMIDGAITGSLIIAKSPMDSLAIADMVMELEDRFDVSIPMSLIAEIHTVDQLTDAVLQCHADQHQPTDV